METKDCMEIDVTSGEVKLAKNILRHHAQKQQKIFSLFVDAVSQMHVHDGRKGYLELHRDTDNEYTVRFQDDNCHSFMIYSFNSMEEIREGFKLIAKYFREGTRITFFSMNDKKLSTKEKDGNAHTSTKCSIPHASNPSEVRQVG